MTATPIICLAAGGIHLISGSFSWLFLGLRTQIYILYFSTDMLCSMLPYQGTKKRKEWRNSLTHFKRTDWNSFPGETQTLKIIMRRWKKNNRFFFSFILRLILFFKGDRSIWFIFRSIFLAGFKASVLEKSFVKSDLIRRFHGFSGAFFPLWRLMSKSRR